MRKYRWQILFFDWLCAAFLVASGAGVIAAIVVFLAILQTLGELAYSNIEDL